MGLREKFEEANTTRDGRLTKSQAEAAAMTQIVANFEAIDVDGAGFVSFEQAKAFKTDKKSKVEQARRTKGRVAQRRAMSGGAAAPA